MTPHAYLINCRIEYSRSELRRGEPSPTSPLKRDSPIRPTCNGLSGNLWRPRLASIVVEPQGVAEPAAYA